MPQHVRFFSDNSLLALKYVDAMVEVGLDVAVIPLQPLDMGSQVRPMLDEDGWQIHNADGEPRNYTVPSPWHRHQARLCKLVEGPYISVCCGSEAEADRVLTPSVRNVYITGAAPTAPAGVDPARGYDEIIVPTGQAFEAWDAVAEGGLTMVVPGVPAHVQRLREALVGINPFQSASTRRSPMSDTSNSNGTPAAIGDDATIEQRAAAIAGIANVAPPSGFRVAYAPPARRQAMDNVIDLLLAQYSPEIKNPDGTPGMPAIACVVTAARQSLQGVMSRHPSVPGVLRLLSQGQDEKGQGIAIEYFFHVDELEAVALLHRTPAAGSRIVT